MRMHIYSLTLHGPSFPIDGWRNDCMRGVGGRRGSEKPQ